jgi:hypothetical protein
LVGLPFSFSPFRFPSRAVSAKHWKGCNES